MSSNQAMIQGTSTRDLGESATRLFQEKEGPKKEDEESPPSPCYSKRLIIDHEWSSLLSSFTVSENTSSGLEHS